jgi:glycerophosphoryl diester phosphodiesterase
MPSRGICAHRGASDTHPENTLAAFREAIRLGVHMIEFDVALSKDGQLVLMHDTTVDRTTDGDGPVSELTLAELKKLDAVGSKNSAEVVLSTTVAAA